MGSKGDSGHEYPGLAGEGAHAPSNQSCEQADLPKLGPSQHSETLPLRKTLFSVPSQREKEKQETHVLQGQLSTQPRETPVRTCSQHGHFQPTWELCPPDWREP